MSDISHHGGKSRRGRGRTCPLCPGRPGASDVDLFRYRQGVIDLDAEIPDRAFDLGMPEQELDGPEISRPPIDQGRFCASKRMRVVMLAFAPRRPVNKNSPGLLLAALR